MERGAVLSPCGRYRFSLTRVWSEGPHRVFVLLNPSTADATTDDPTLRRCMRFARDWGYGGLTLVNLFPWRATHPQDLGKARAAGEDITAVERNRTAWLHALAKTDALPLFGWGAHALAVEAWPRLLELTPGECLGITKTGAPRHPLYIRADTQPMPWEPPQAC